MEEQKKNLSIPILVLALLYVFSLIFFHFVEGWSFVDAAYFTTMTISTVGFGDVTPTTLLGKIGAIFLVFAGVSLAFYVITHLGAIREKTVDTHIQKRLHILKSLTDLKRSKVKDSDINKLRKKI